MKNKLKNIDCRFVEKVLFETSLEEINENEKNKILNHLSECENCKSSEKLIGVLNESMVEEFENSKLVPKSETIQSLKHTIISFNKEKRSLFGFIEKFLKLRVPVYQVITAILIIVIISFFINNSKNEFDSINNNISFIAEIDSNKILMNYQNSLELINSSGKGKSFVEDSVLSSFIQSAM